MREHFAEYLLLYSLYAFALRSFLTTSGCLKKSNWIIQLCAACPIGTLCVVVVFVVVTDAASLLPWYDTCLLFLNYIKYLKHMQI